MRNANNWFRDVFAPEAEGAIAIANKFLNSLPEQELDDSSFVNTVFQEEPISKNMLLKAIHFPNLFEKIPHAWILEGFFGQPTELIRGLLLIATATAYVDMSERENTLAKTSSILGQEFGIAHQEVARLLATSWLENIWNLAFAEGKTSKWLQPSLEQYSNEDLRLRNYVADLDSSDVLIVRLALGKLGLALSGSRQSLSEEMIEKCRKLLRSTDSVVLTYSINLLKQCSDDKISIGCDFVKVFCDHTRKRELRCAAYHGLFDLFELMPRFWFALDKIKTEIPALATVDLKKLEQELFPGTGEIDQFIY